MQKVIITVLLLILVSCEPDTDTGSNFKTESNRPMLIPEYPCSIDPAHPGVKYNVGVYNLDNELISEHEYTDADFFGGNGFLMDGIPTKGAFGITVSAFFPCLNTDCCSGVFEDVTPMFGSAITDQMEQRTEYNVKMRKTFCPTCVAS